ncbi:hypothetical protein NKH77_24085 [Streptomyces sp. M19]
MRERQRFEARHPQARGRRLRRQRRQRLPEVLEQGRPFLRGPARRHHRRRERLSLDRGRQEGRRHGQGRQGPDIAQIGAYADYAAAGRLYRADELLSIPTQAAFITSIARAGEVQRIPYGMPFVASSRRLFYNKKLFDQAGVTGAPRAGTS